MKRLLTLPMLAVLVALLACWVAPANADDSPPRISRIDIQGLQELDPEVVRGQLPFRVGDVWEAELGELAVDRLYLLPNFEMFPAPPRIATVSDGAGGIIVTIVVEEKPRWWPGVVRFGGQALFSLVSGQFTYTANTLTSRGLSAGGTLYWGDTSGFSLDVVQPVVGGTGGIAAAGYADLEVEQDVVTGPFAGSSYQEEVEGVTVSYRTLYSPEVGATYSLGYQRSDFSDVATVGGLTLPAQEYLTLDAQARFPALLRDGFAFTLRGRYLTALAGEVPSFPAAEGALEWRDYQGRWGLYARAAAGTMDEDAPFNQLFRLGGFENPFLRGALDPYIGDAYAAGTLELRYRATSNYSAFTFVDAGATWLDGERSSGDDTVYTYGVGAVYHPAADLISRFTIAVDPEQDSTTFGVQIGRFF